jgi:glycine betaine/proline transport system permease protein
VLVPSAAPGLMVGVNQVIMLSLNMVIIASMIGAGGLGFDVLASLRRLDIGAGLEAGIAIVVMAIALDRLSQAFAERAQIEQHDAVASAGWVRRHRWLSTVIAVVATTTLVGFVVPAAQAYPEAMMIATGPV